MKKTCIKLIILLLFASPALAWDASLAWNATFAPPHNEPVVGNKVARYRLQLEPQVSAGWLSYSFKLNAWGVNTWQPPSVVGNGIPDAWEGSDWSVDEWRYSTLHTLKLGPDRFHGFVEYYMPLDRKTWGGHGMERHYYLLTGFGGRFDW